MVEFFNKVKLLLDQYSLCDSCLGRQFGQLLTQSTNRKRGEALIISLAMELHYNIINNKAILEDFEKYLFLPNKIFKASYNKIASAAEVQSLSKDTPESNTTIKQSYSQETRECAICKGIFAELSLFNLAEKINGTAKLFEFSSYLLGSKIPSSMIEIEENIRSKFNLKHGESIKSDLNRETGKLLEKLSEFKDKTLDFERPDIVFVINLTEDSIETQINPIFIYGKYNKLVRGIPQTIWYCNSCWGKGCDECQFSGRKLPDAVEEYVLPRLIQQCQGKDGKFHGSGREDVDALMLGEGRPFVAQVNEPKKRSIALKDVEDQINLESKGRVKITLEKFVNRDVVRSIKNNSPNMRKHYRLGIKVPPLSKIDFEKLQNLIGEIRQQTPKRVLHRRSDLTRYRRVFHMFGKQIDTEHIEVEIICSGGLYVKELVHGDEGRTQPNLSQVLGIPLLVDYLDVLEVKEETL